MFLLNTSTTTEQLEYPCLLLGAMPVQQCDMSDVQLLSRHQKLHSDQDHLRLHLAAWDHCCLHYAVTWCRSTAETGMTMKIH